MMINEGVPVNQQKKIVNDHLFTCASLPLYLLAKLFKKPIRLSLIKSGPKQIDASVAAGNFGFNMKNMNGVCECNGIIFCSVLQPINGIGNRSLTDSDSIISSVMKKTLIQKDYSLFDFYLDYYREIRNHLSSENFFVDMSTVFDDKEGQIFFDTCHFSDKGQEIVAQVLCDLIIKKAEK